MNHELMQLRQQVDQFMRHHPQSPLSAAQKADFGGLTYYEEDPALRFEVEVELFPSTQPMVTMETSTGEKRPYRQYGRFQFTVDGQDAELTLYSDLYGQDFFLPFRDATSGKETYGAGRYLDNHRPSIAQIQGNRFRIDFNFAYNPYCAYSESYSCPLPPQENWLSVPIAAGEKKFE